MKPKIFLHHQRCGGSTLRNAYNAHGIPYRANDVQERILGFHADGINFFEVEPGIYMDYFEDTFDYFTIIRDPIERAISLIELRSRPDDGVNTFNCPSYEYRYTDEFWQGVRDHLEVDISVLRWHYRDAYVRSMASNMLAEPDHRSLQIAVTRLRSMPVLLYNKDTYRYDLPVFMERLGIEQTFHIGTYMKGNDEFAESVPEWVRLYLESINLNDYYVYKYLQGRADENNIVMGD